jgi:hypothetical protein
VLQLRWPGDDGLSRPAPERGSLAVLPYLTANGVKAYSHIVDPKFLWWWMEHPNFHMIK